MANQILTDTGLSAKEKSEWIMEIEKMTPDMRAKELSRLQRRNYLFTTDAKAFYRDLTERRLAEKSLQN